MIDPADAVKGYVDDLLIELAEADAEILGVFPEGSDEAEEIAADTAERNEEWLALWAALTAELERLRQ